MKVLFLKKNKGRGPKFSFKNTNVSLLNAL